MCGSALSRQRFCQNLLVEPIGFSYPATQIYPFDGAFEISFGDIDKETWRSAFAVVYAINDTNRIDDKELPSANSRSIAVRLHNFSFLGSLWSFIGFENKTS